VDAEVEWLGGQNSVIGEVAVGEYLVAGKTRTSRPYLRIRTFNETERMYGVTVCQNVVLASFHELIFPIQVVDPFSAIMGVPHEQACGLNGNHVSICKYANGESSDYQTVLASIEAVVTELEEGNGERTTENLFPNIAEMTI